MNEELQKLSYALSGIIMENEKREAEAVAGYNEQLKLIDLVRIACEGDAEYISFLDMLEAATKEKIQDELNHGESLYREFVQMTGIQPAED